jgi:hypothetical protein
LSSAAGHCAQCESSSAAITQRAQNTLFGVVGVQAATVTIDAITVGLGAGAFASRAFGSEGGARACGGQGSLELCDRIQNATGEYRGPIIRLGALLAALTIRAPFFAASRSMRMDTNASRTMCPPVSLNVEVMVRVVDRVSPVSAWMRVSIATAI